jgi:hypothetical protein
LKNLRTRKKELEKNKKKDRKKEPEKINIKERL